MLKKFKFWFNYNILFTEMDWKSYYYLTQLQNKEFSPKEIEENFPGFTIILPMKYPDPQYVFQLIVSSIDWNTP